jgi:hypothetical protein
MSFLIGGKTVGLSLVCCGCALFASSSLLAAVNRFELRDAWMLYRVWCFY